LAFWEEAERLRLSKWRKRYDPSDIGIQVFDGGAWSFRAQIGRTRIDTYGDNAGPALPNVHKTRVDSDAIKPLEDAIRKLKQHE
jgi:hypothetical protein